MREAKKIFYNNWRLYHAEEDQLIRRQGRGLVSDDDEDDDRCTLTGYKNRGPIRSRCSFLLGVVQFLAQFRCSFCESGNRRRNRHPVTSVNMLCFMYVYVLPWSMVGLSRFPNRGIKAENHPSFSIIRITNSQDRSTDQLSNNGLQGILRPIF